MCLLQAGQIVELAASLISCFAPHSKHWTTELPRGLKRPSNFRKIDGSRSTTGSSFDFNLICGLGAEGANEPPHWRHIVLFAATYSICLKPQCGQSTLTLAGDDFTTER